MSDRERLALVGLVDSIDNLVIRSRFAREVLADPAPPEPAPESEEPPRYKVPKSLLDWFDRQSPAEQDRMIEVLEKEAARLRARPGPAPEPQCACLDFWTTHHPECPRVLAGLEKAGVPAPEPEKLRRLAEEWLRWEAETNKHPGVYDLRGELDSLARLLERVIRETAAVLPLNASHPCDGAPRLVLRHWNLSPSPESPKEGRVSDPAEALARKMAEDDRPGTWETLLPFAKALIQAEKALADATDYVVSEWTGVGGKDLTRGDIPRFQAALASLRSLLAKP